MGLLGDASAMELLDKAGLEVMHYARIRPYKVIASKSARPKPSRKLLDTINHTLNSHLQNSFVEVGPQKTKISLYDFAVYVETLHLCWRNIDHNHPSVCDRFKACFPVFDEPFVETSAAVVERIQNILRFLAWINSDLTRYIFRFYPEEKKESKSVFDTSVYFNNYVFDNRKPATETLKVDGHNRIIYGLCVGREEGFIPVTITPEKLGLVGVLQKFPLNVFIQQHVLERIEIRLGKFFRSYHFMFIITAILTEEPVPADTKNSFLFPVTWSRVKLGYLKADVIGDKLLIRTFLFLTNNGTPEGKKLGELVGLQKADKKYLEIDKLSTFVASDIKNSKKLKALFCEAGCGELFSLDKSLLDEHDRRNVTCAEFLTKYLGL
jgi:hypothetical protein